MPLLSGEEERVEQAKSDAQRALTRLISRTFKVPVREAKVIATSVTTLGAPEIQTNRRPAGEAVPQLTASFPDFPVIDRDDVTLHTGVEVLLPLDDDSPASDTLALAFYQEDWVQDGVSGSIFILASVFVPD